MGEGLSGSSVRGALWRSDGTRPAGRLGAARECRSAAYSTTSAHSITELIECRFRPVEIQSAPRLPGNSLAIEGFSPVMGPVAPLAPASMNLTPSEEVLLNPPYPAHGTVPCA